MAPRTWIVAVALAFAATAYADDKPSMSPNEVAGALIGVESTTRLMGEKVGPDTLSCVDRGGGYMALDNQMLNDWSDAVLVCQGRLIVTLERKVGEANGLEKWRIVDTLLLPPLQDEWNPRRPNALMYIHSSEGVCGLTSRPGTSYFTLVRWGKRKRIDWRTGVERAWTFDIAQGRIVPLSTRHIYCEWVDP